MVTEFNMPGQSNVNWAIMGKLLVSCFDGDIPKDRFKQYLQMLDTHRPSYIFNLSLGSGSVDSVQRKEAAGIVKAIEPKIAVVVDSAISRGVLTALGWLGVNIKAFGPGDERKALEYLNAPGVRHEDILDVLAKLREGSKR